MRSLFTAKKGNAMEASRPNRHMARILVFVLLVDATMLVLGVLIGARMDYTWDVFTGNSYGYPYGFSRFGGEAYNRTRLVAFWAMIPLFNTVTAIVDVHRHRKGKLHLPWATATAAAGLLLYSLDLGLQGHCMFYTRYVGGRTYCPFVFPGIMQMPSSDWGSWITTAWYTTWVNILAMVAYFVSLTAGLVILKRRKIADDTEGDDGVSYEKYPVPVAVPSMQVQNIKRKPVATVATVPTTAAWCPHCSPGIDGVPANSRSEHVEATPANMPAIQPDRSTPATTVASSSLSYIVETPPEPLPAYDRGSYEHRPKSSKSSIEGFI